MATTQSFSFTLSSKRLLTEHQQLSQQHEELSAEIFELLHECIAALDNVISDPTETTVALYLKVSTKRKEKSQTQEKVKYQMRNIAKKMQTQFGVPLA